MQKAALGTAGIIFLIVSTLHIARSLLATPVTVGGASIPVALSWIGAALSLALALWMFTASRK